MKVLRFMRIFSLTIPLLFLSFGTIPAFGTDELRVTKITRITHQAYSASNLWFGAQYPWNSDRKRIMLYEVSSFNPVYGETGRGLRWGYISELKSWTTLSEYKTAARDIKDSVHITVPGAAKWSPFSDEPNIIYAPFYSGSNGTYLKKINVDTGQITNVVSISDDGYNTRKMMCYGWTTASTGNKLICSIAGDDDWSVGGYEIDVKAGTKTYISYIPKVPYGKTEQYKITSCSQVEDRYWTYPNMGHGHGGRNPSGTMVSINQGFGGAVSKGTFVKNGCGGKEFFETVSSPETQYNAHISWTASDDWYLAGGAGDGTWGSAPNIDKMTVYQVIFRPNYQNKTATYTYIPLWTKASAGRWETSPGKQDHYNWGAIPIPTLRNDGLQALFFSTDGKYSYGDYIAEPSLASNWGTEGAFLADFAPDLVNSGTTPNPPILLNP
jgi:hypothetical protein